MAKKEKTSQTPTLRRTRKKETNFEEFFLKSEKLEKDEPGERKTEPKKPLFGKLLLITLATIVIASLLGTSGYFYYQYRKALKNPGAAAQMKVKTLVGKIGDLMYLPQGEEPTVATVADVEKIKSQPFFANAQNGDKVLFYTEAQKAILYRPSENKIVEAASMSGATSGSQAQNNQNTPNASSIPEAQSSAPAVTEAPAETQPVQSQASEAPKMTQVAVYNGGKIKGLAQKIGDIVALMPDVTVSEKTNAEGSYPKTIVIDLSSSRGEMAQKIAETLGGEVAALPESEIKPEADILIIGGSDFNK